MGNGKCCEECVFWDGNLPDLPPDRFGCSYVNRFIRRGRTEVYEEWEEGFEGDFEVGEKSSSGEIHVSSDSVCERFRPKKTGGFSPQPGQSKPSSPPEKNTFPRNYENTPYPHNSYSNHTRQHLIVIPVRERCADEDRIRDTLLHLRGD